jgi:ferrous iron transport protein B
MDLFVNIVDASRLERNLLLTLQLLETHKNMVIILNFMDRVKDHGMEIDTEALGEIFGVPILATSATHLKPAEVREFVSQAVINPIKPQSILLKELIGKEDLRILDDLRSDLPENYQSLSDGFLFILIMLKENLIYPKIPKDKLNPVLQIFLKLNSEATSTDVHNHKYHDLEFVEKEYKLIHSLVDKFISRKMVKVTRYSRAIEKIDNILMHQVLGPLIFLAVMFAMFQLTFVLSGPVMDYLDAGFVSLSEWSKSVISNPILGSFVADGLINGIGFVLIFIPQIMFVFIGLSFLENSGYLNRAVFVMDLFLSKIGITGQSLAPLILGFGCNIPGILATKSISDEKQRILTAVVNPFIPCSARIPVFVLLSTAFFPDNAGLVMTLMYLIGIVVALLVIWILYRVTKKGEETTLIMEMPDLGLPPVKIMIHQTYLYLKEFILNAAKWITIGVIFIWVLSVFGPSGFIGPEALEDVNLLEKSWIYMIGQVIGVLFYPLGWDVRAVIALIFGFVAKEIIVSTLGVLYATGGGSLIAIMAGTFTPVEGFAYMVFITLYFPCIGTLFVMKDQIGKKWTAVSVSISLSVAYILALLITVIGNSIY